MDKTKKRLISKRAKKEISITRGSGNVFTDLGFIEAAELQVKAGLTHQICDRIKEFGFTQDHFSSARQEATSVYKLSAQGKFPYD